ncbi:hypothetical protein [Amycolatopsis sp. CA-230715]|uniref:hypothetical protein n=1 Tax=Amycolatopsis sp. CA-230715 TaxID=2745196 RepID=UPI001C32369C|nr:hypothetical protein HUW46_01551 [Amycolatopsis sp. CA-230715]
MDSSVGPVDEGTMVIDCDRCEVRGDACADCVVSVLLGAPPEIEWDSSERLAVDALAEAGMVPRLRLVPAEPERRLRAG